MSKVKIEGNASGTGTLTISAPNTNTDRSLTLPDGAGEILTDASTLSSSNLSGALPAIDGSALTGVGGPAFKIRKLSNHQTISSGVLTKITFDTEVFDTDNCVASSRFTPTKAGYYFIGLSLYFNYTEGTPTYAIASLLKNGSTYDFNKEFQNAYWGSIHLSTVVYMNGTTDYIEAHGQMNASPRVDASEATTLEGFWIKD